jgi:signal transduction histidine kinase/integral membrane sensor domain MASE1
METGRSRPSWDIANVGSPFRTVILVCAVAMLCYLAGELGHALIIPPDYTTAFWPATPLLVAVLLLVPRRIWPGLIAAGFGAMVVSDLQNGVPLSSLIWFTLGDAVGVLIAALGVSHLFNGTPHLNTAKVLARYFLFVVILAFVSALVGANAPERGSTYWLQTKLWFLSNSIAYLTVTPAAWSWVGGRAWARKSRGYYLEAAALIFALTVFGYLAFAAPGGSTPPVLLYLPVPFLLWAALRFGSFGVANSVVVIALLSIWGVAHGRGPFTEPTPLNNVLSLQLFLLFTAASSMFLAVFVEEHNRAEEKLRESEERLRLAAGAGKMFAFEWDAVTDVIVRSGESGRILDIDEATSGQQVWAQVHPDDREKLTAAMAVLSADNPEFQVSHRMVRPDGTVIWVERNCRAHFDNQGKLLRIVGMVADVTQRKRVEEALKDSEDRLRLAVKAGQMYAFEWEARTDVIVRLGECGQILHWMDDPTHDTGRQFVTSIHPDDRETYAGLGTRLTPENPTCLIIYRVLRPDGGVIWLEARGHAFFDEQGRMLRIRGMVADVTERKRTEVELRESEERLRMAAQAGRMYAYEWDVASDVVVRSPECADLLGLGTPLRTTRRELLNSLHPDDRGLCGDLNTVTPENPTLRARYRIRRQDGTWMWAEKTARAFFDEQGRMVRMIGMIADTTLRRLTEEALSTVSRRLIVAQEQERARIARELHDDLGQRMALLSISLEQFEQDTEWLSSTARQQLHKIAEVSTEISSSIHDLSYQLHPSKLDTLGLLPSLRGFCREFSEQHHLKVQFVHHDIPRQIPKDVTLCLFRIAQEALQNVVKHSGAAEANVELSGQDGRINLGISDSGAGFSPESVEGDTGLGLISMRERLRLVGGHLSVESYPSHGTRIRVSVPLFRADAEGTNEGKTRKAGA